MRRTTLTLAGLATAALLVAGTPLSAQQHGQASKGTGSGSGSMGMMDGCPMMGMTGTRMGGQAMPMQGKARLAALKTELGITEAQGKAWEAYAAAVAKNIEAMQGMHQSMPAAMKGTAVERLDGQLAMMESRLTALKETKPALAALYAVLSEQQKKKADQALAGKGCMM